MQVEVAILNAFTFNGSGGNPAGVVLNAEFLNTKQMQEIAQQVGLSETAFVIAASDLVQGVTSADFSVRFFTPTAEVNFCGHATVAIYSLLKQRDILAAGNITQATKAGLLNVNVAPDASVLVQLALPEFGPSFAATEIAALLNINPDVISATGLPTAVVSTGLSDLMVPIARGQLDLIMPDLSLIRAFSREHNLVGLHLFELTEQDDLFFAHCRNFAPWVGIEEESATGSSSGALACYLFRHLKNAPTQFVFEQGRAMAASSRLSATVDHQANQITNISVGGVATISHTITISL